MTEYVKFNCHVMARNELSKSTTPKQLLEQYTVKRGNKDYDYIFDDVKTVILSCDYANGRTAIITKIGRLGDGDNGIICSE